jgi:ABC-type branched-subunit amino acid transport system substrate-binding protein
MVQMITSQLEKAMLSMTGRSRALRLVAMAAMLLSACSDGGDAQDVADVADGGADGGGNDLADEHTLDEGAADSTGDAPDGVAFAQGVTAEPCPNAVNPENGCIYLGQLADLSGPFAIISGPLTAGVRDFWARVNAEGGIGGFDVDVETYLRDNSYNPAVHLTRYREIEPHVLALAMSLGTTLASLPLQEEDDMLAVPASWWSGWEFQELILQSGYNYCLEAMNAIDHAHDAHGAASAMSVYFPGDYGGESAHGASLAAARAGLEWRGAIQALPSLLGGDQSAVVDEIVRLDPDVVIIATGPQELAEIVGGALAAGFQGRFLGSLPTWSPLLLSHPASTALEGSFELVAPFGDWGTDSDAHRAMAEAVEQAGPPGSGYVIGWVHSYPLRAALERAVANRDLTRHGLRRVVTEITVDYEGALPARTYAGTPDETVERHAVIARIDRDNPAGVSVFRDFFVGPSAEGFELTEPCVALPVEE